MPVSFFYGGDLYSLHAAVGRITHGGTFGEMDVIRLSADASSPHSILMSVGTTGLFAEQRLIIVEGMGQIKPVKQGKGGKLPKSQTDARLSLAALSAATPETATVVVTAPGVRADSMLVKEAVKLAREGTIQVRNFAAPRQKDMPGWILAEAKAQGLKMAAGVAQQLALRVGEQTSIAGIELQKLAAAAAPSKTVSVELVQRLVPQSADESIFPLIDAIAGGQSAQGYRLLERQLAQVTGNQNEVSLPLIRLLARQFRILLRMRLLRAEGMSRAEIMSELKISDYFAERYVQQAARFSPSQLMRAMDSLVQAEQSIKNGDASESVLHLLLARLAEPAAVA